MSEGTSILGQLAAGIKERKEATAGGRLTATGEEKAAAPGTPAIIPMIPVMFPNDHPTEVILSVIRDLERQREIIDSLIADMRSTIKMDAPEAVVADDDKAKERAADVRARSNEAKVNVIATSSLAEEAVAGMEASKAILVEMAALQSSDPEAFRVRMEALKANAQAHAFAPETPGTALPNMVEPADDTVTSGAAEVSVAAGGWVCPSHGSFVNAVSRKGRHYRKCPAPECQNFELP